MGPVSFWRFRGPAHASACLGINCYGSLEILGSVNASELTDIVADVDPAVSSHATKNEHQKRDFGINRGIFHRQLHQFVLIALAAAFDSGK